MKSILLKCVLIAGLFAMIPGALNGGVPADDNPGNGKNTSAAIQSSQQDFPLNLPFFSRRKVQEVVPAVGNGVKAYLVFTKLKKQGEDNDVLQVYYIKQSYFDDNEQHDPPDVRGLIYHNLGEGKEFLGIKIYQPIYRENGTRSGMMREVKLDDVSAQYLIDFKTDDTKWKDKTGITYEETNSPRVMVPEAH